MGSTNSLNFSTFGVTFGTTVFFPNEIFSSFLSFVFATEDQCWSSETCFANFKLCVCFSKFCFIGMQFSFSVCSFFAAWWYKNCHWSNRNIPERTTIFPCRIWWWSELDDVSRPRVFTKNQY